MLAAKPKQKQKQKKSRQEINEASRELKRKRKHKGLPSGSTKLIKIHELAAKHQFHSCLMRHRNQ